MTYHPLRPTPPDRLGDEALLVMIRDAISAAQCRATLKPALRRLLAETLAEEKLEMLIGADPSLTVADLERAAAVDSEIDLARAL